MFTREFDGKTFRKSSRSGAGNDCVYLPAAGILNQVADSKSGAVLSVARVNPRSLAALSR